MSVSQIYMVFNGRFPSEKAAALFAAKSAEAFSEQGIRVTLLVPRRLRRITESYTAYYGMKESFAVRFLPTIDLFQIHVLSKIAFAVHMFSFSLSVFIFSLFKVATRKHTLFYSDSLQLLIALSFVFPTFYELHDFPEKKFALHRWGLRRITKILSTNKWKASKLFERFSISQQKVLVEPNAVDLNDQLIYTKPEARSQLGLEIIKPLVVYTGHLYSWKGVDTLVEAAKLLPQYQFVFVGGTPEDVTLYKAEHSLLAASFIGHVPHVEALLWQSAADVLVLPNTAKQKISAYYTSPMKLFEYLASGRIVVASRLPSIESIVGSGDDAPVVWAEADNPMSFRDAIIEAVQKSSSETIPLRARELVENHSWSRRAARILLWINQ